MSLSIGSKIAELVNVIHLNGLEHVNITSDDVRTGKVSINSEGKKIIGTNTEHFLENNTIGTALASDINRDKTLYVNGQLVTGTYDELTVNTSVRGNINQYVANENISAGSFVKKTKSVIDSTEIGVSTPLVFENTTIDNVATLSLSDNKVLVAYRDVSNSWRGTLQIFTIEDASIVEGKKYVFNNYDTQYINLLLLEDNKVLIVFNDGQNSYGSARVININGDNYTSGPKFIYDQVTVIHMSVTRLYSNKVLVAYNDGSNTYGTAQILTIIGDTVSGSDPVVFNPYHTTNINTLTLNINKVLVSYTDASASGKSYGVSQILTINDNVITSSEKFIFNNDITSEIKTVLLNENKVLIAYRESSSNIRGIAVVLTIDGTNIHIGTETVITVDNIEYLTLLPATEDKAIAIYRRYNNTSWNGTAVILHIANGSIIQGDNFLFSSGNIYNVSASVLTDNKVLVVYIDDVNYDYSTIQLMQPDISNIFSNTIYEYIYENRVKKISSNSDTILGVAVSSGNLGENIDVKIPF